MSSGYIELAAIGQQDAYLVGSPQVTYFAGKYNQHTPFALEAYEIPFKTQNLRFGDTAVCEIPAKGDLVRGLLLKMDLPGLYTPTPNWTWPIMPSPQNFPTLWFGLGNGSIVGPFSGTYTDVPYYSSNTLDVWGTAFTSNVAYSSALNKFLFTGISNVIVPSNEPLFWGFDPENYTFVSGSNLIYNADLSGNLVPDFSLQLAGWINRDPVFPDTQIFLNLSDWAPGIQANGLYKFASAGYYTVQLGFTLGPGSGTIQTVSYGHQASAVFSPQQQTFDWTYTLANSPNPTTQIILPVVVTDPTQYYYFYASTNGTPISFVNGTYMVIEPVDLIAAPAPGQPVSPSAQIPFFPLGNFPSQVSCSSNGKFSNLNGNYLFSGVIGADVTRIDVYQQLTRVWTVIQKDQTWAFSFPISELNSSNIYSIVPYSGTGTYTVPGTFVAIKNIDNGILATGAGSIDSNGFINVASYTNQYDSSNVYIKPSGKFRIVNPGTYMVSSIFRGVVRDSGAPSQFVSFLNAGDNAGANTLVYQYNISEWDASGSSYVVSFPVRITDTNNYYYLSFNGIVIPVTLGSSSYVTVYPIETAYIPMGVLFPPYNYCDSVGTFAILSAELRIGGQTVQRLTGEYIELWNELNVPLENQAGLKLLTGKYDTGTSVPDPGRTYYVNLPFYFYGAPELSVPMCALGKHSVEVWLTFNEFENLTSVQIPDPRLAATIITEYVYLADPEIDWFKNHRLDYVMTQSQYQDFALFPNQPKHILELNFINPVKELVFVLQNQGTAPYDYSNNGLQSLGLTFNGQDAFLADPTDAIYLGTIEPMNHHINFFSIPPGSTIPGRQFFLYSFSTDPNSPNPSGQINFSRIRQILLELNEVPPGPNQSFRVLAVSQNILRVENGLGGIMFN